MELSTKSSEPEQHVALDMRAAVAADAHGDHDHDADQLLERKKKKTTLALPPAVDPGRDRFPFCIVWSPIPVITWLLPFIGHLGIANSEGVIYDFAGPYTIGRDSFAFGIPTRYIQCSVGEDQAAKWDDAVAKGCAVYETRMHNLCCDNCHSHVAVCLENVQYAGIKRWNMVILCLWMFFCGRYVDVVGFLKSWVPSLLLLGFILLVHSAV